MTGASPWKNSICLGCGLCCDGTLHGRVMVEPADKASLAAVGLEMEKDGRQRFFRQPCPCFSSGACSIYRARPAVCRTYRCALLKDLDSRKIRMGEALETIATAKALVARVTSIDSNALTPAKRAQLARRLRAELREASTDERTDIARRLLDAAALEYFLDRRFRKEKTS